MVSGQYGEEVEGREVKTPVVSSEGVPQDPAGCPPQPGTEETGDRQMAETRD